MHLINKHNMQSFLSTLLHLKRLFQFQFQSQFFCLENLSFLRHDLNVALLIMLKTFKTLIKMNMNFIHIIITCISETEFHYYVIKKINIFSKIFLIINAELILIKHDNS